MQPTLPSASPTGRKPFASLSFDRAPLLAIWELTQACDLVCAHCRACATPGRDKLELTTEEGKKLLSDIAAMGAPTVVLTGGDPAKRPDLVELIEHGARAGLAMAATPSGTPLMTQPLLAQMKNAGLSRLAVSVDGPDAATHDAFRGVEGSFAESVRILRQAREVGLPVQINTSLHPGNLSRLGEMGKMVAEIGAALWSVFVIVPTGRATASLLLGPKRLEKALEELADIAATAPFDVKTTAAPHFRRVLMERRAPGGASGVLRDVDEDGVVRGPRGITDGVGFVFISHRGDICPSGFLPTAAGNVRTDDIATVYRTSPLFVRLRDADALEGKCGACPFRKVCGGSRARAYSMKGDVMAEDPLCAYVPRGYDHHG